MNIKIDDFKLNKPVSALKISPDGRSKVFTVTDVDMASNGYKNSFYMLDENDSLKRLSTNDVSSTYAIDNSGIIFAKSDEKRKYASIVYRLSFTGGERQELFRLMYPINSVRVLDEDNLVLMISNSEKIRHFKDMDQETYEKKSAEIKQEDDYTIYDEIPFYLNGAGYINKIRTSLAIYNIKSGALKILTDDFTNVSSYDIAPNKSEIIYTSESYTDKAPLKSQLYVYSFESDKSVKLEYDEDLTYYGPSYAGEDVFIFATDQEAHGINQNMKVYLIDKSKEGMRCINEDFDMSIGSSVGSDLRYGGGYSFRAVKDKLYFIATLANSADLFAIDKAGKVERLSKVVGSVDEFDACESGIYAIGMLDYNLQEVYKFEEGKFKKVTAINEALVKAWKAKPYEKITFKNDDIDFEGFVIKPDGYKKGKKYPAILEVHGGPKTVTGELLYHEYLYFAKQGYFVLFTNPRGADGRGNDFMNIRGKYGTIDFDDLMKFTDAALERYEDIDRDNLHVTGGSYGGFMTNWIIGHTNRFKSAASQRSISNWLSFFGVSDIGYYFATDQNLADPFLSPEALWERSPLKYASEVKTPTLFIHSDEDYRCPLEQGVQMFTALKYFGVDSKIVIFHGENHELSRSGKPKHRQRRLDEIITWIKKRS
ncbi:alpha/beta hydrolase family protein [Fenollaria sporofastidiosus]|uniref:alpha/beta hydrolase family protein n=1 Tax=Fenollaria sporofastidiosus TaxID=2811778 RepID=UPI00203B8641|nr:S9 family peptidase [Fenollaria sporofastidiosus]